MDKYIKHGLKIAGFCFTAPATFMVAAAVNPDAGLLTWLSQVSGLMLVEGVMLLGWYRLDNTPDATNARRWLYAAMAFVGFVDLAIIAAAHGEGLAGLAFRLPLLVAIVYSIAESGILASIQINRDADRSILKDFYVRAHARKLDRAEAKAERSAMNAVRIAFLQAEQRGGLHAAGLYAEHLEAQNDATHELPAVITHNPTHKQPKWDTWVDPRTEAKDSAKQLTAAILAAEPGITTYELSQRVGKSDTTVRKYRREIEAEHPATGNGHRPKELAYPGSGD